jgi:hypothetical protein
MRLIEVWAFPALAPQREAGLVLAPPMGQLLRYMAWISFEDHGLTEVRRRIGIGGYAPERKLKAALRWRE